MESLAFFEEYEVDLEARILSDAVQGALNCGPGIFGNDLPPSVPMDTSLTGESCVPEVSLCNVLQTNFEIVVDKAVSPEATAFLGYIRLSNTMSDYPNGLVDLDRVEYMRPLLFPPLLGDNNETTVPPTPILNGVDSISVSPWTIGAVLAVCIGGATALGVWARNRQRRNEQHIQLLEDMSLGEDRVA